MAYYEDARRDVNNYGKSFLFADGLLYHLSFDVNRQSLGGKTGSDAEKSLDLGEAVGRGTSPAGFPGYAVVYLLMAGRLKPLYLRLVHRYEPDLWKRMAMLPLSSSYIFSIL
ncbi:MAG: hypothetical protein C4527_08615 [Candidatus Omnitrophota bacterium]|jgi:hypothetical protein|nr:MAG: hypothetical protein C4527_08615 [Candidatus Omnitrophota bacterium]